MAKSTIPNIVFFGSSGSGKSSIINMIAGQKVADVSNAAEGCTSETACYQVNIRGSIYNLHDTTGLNEDDEGKVPSKKAITQLFRLLKNQLADGVNLLIFCMQYSTTFQESTATKNWRLFYEFICQKKVPVLIAVTGLENEDMKEWGIKYKWWFERCGMSDAKKILCITAIRGEQESNKPGVFKLDEKYADSRVRMSESLREYCSHTPEKPLPIEWFSAIKVWWYWCFNENLVGPGVNELVERCGMKRKDAKALAEMLSKV